MNVLFVCLGNSCRSPMAEGILKQLFIEHQLEGKIESAGFESVQTDGSPNEKAVKVSANHGIDIRTKRARKFHQSDFDAFDRIFVMDQKNMNDIMQVARNENDKMKVDYLLNLIEPGKDKQVSDPYYGGVDSYEHTFQTIEPACIALVNKIKNTK